MLQNAVGQLRGEAVEVILIRAVVEWNLRVYKDILTNPDNWGSGSKVDWERVVSEQETLLKLLGVREFMEFEIKVS